MNYLLKDFLSFEDVGEYLKQYGYLYNIQIESDYQELKNTILDLYNEKKLSIVFYYSGLANISTLKTNKNGVIEQIAEFAFDISGYFHIPEAMTILRDEGSLEIRDNYYRYYLLHDKDKLPIYDDDNDYGYVIDKKFTSIELGDDIAPSIIGFSDIRFPKADLDKLFNHEHSDLRKIQDELAAEKLKNAQLVADKETSQVTGSFMMGVPKVEHGKKKTYEELIKNLATANNEIAELKNQLAQAKAGIADKPFDDKELAPNSEAKVAKLIYTLLSELKYELTLGGKGNANLLIENASKNLNTPLSPNFIAYWLKKAYQLQIKDLNN